MSYEEKLRAVCEAHPEIVVMTAENRAAIRGLPARLGPRFIDVGIAEQTLVGMAAGLALRGKVPFVHALAPFLTMRALEFIRTDVALARLPVKLVGYVPGLLSDGNGPTHQSLEDIALMRTLPGMQVFCPADLDELLAALPFVVEGRAPCYMRYVDGPARVRHARPPATGSAELIADGADVAILSYGPLLGEAADAVERLRARGVATALVNVRWLKPLDEPLLLEVAQKSRLLVCVEDHFTTGALYSALCELLVRARLLRPVAPMAFAERWFTPGRLAEVLETEKLSGARLAERVAKACEDLS